MVSFDVETVGDSPDEMAGKLQQIGNGIPGVANDALVEVAEDVKEDLEETSPVDEGDYKDGWYGPVEVADDEVWILNEEEHAKFVILPNSKMRGSANADLPSVGILHNVKGVAKEHSEGLNKSFSARLRDFFRSFGKK